MADINHFLTFFYLFFQQTIQSSIHVKLVVVDIRTYNTTPSEIQSDNNHVNTLHLFLNLLKK